MSDSMILYHAISSYQLLQSMVHKLLYHKSKKAILLTTNFLVEKFPIHSKMYSLFFDEVVVYHSHEIKGQEKLDLLDNTNDYFTRFFEKEKINLDDLDHIFVSCAHSFFGIYLINIKKNFIFMEDASGLLSRPEILMNIEKKLFLAKHEISESFGLYNGDNELILEKYCNLQVQLPGFKDSKAVHIDIVKSLDLLLPNELEIVLNFFGVDHINFDENSMLILTQHFANLGIMSFEDQILIYQLLVDYFSLDYKVIFKLHPDDLMYYNLLFPESVSLKGKFPAELLPYAFKNPPKAALTVSSTAINNIGDQFERKIIFDNNFEYEFKKIHRYYTALKFLDLLSYSNRKIYSYGVNEAIMKNLINYSDLNLYNRSLYELSNINDISNNCIVVLDKHDCDVDENIDIIKCIKELDSNSVLLFLNSNEDYWFYSLESKKLLLDMIPITITKTANAKDIYQDLESETIYIYTKNEEVKKMIAESEFKRKLDNTGIVLGVEKKTQDELRIKVLEGILEATEKRLLHYIKLNKELASKIENKM
ncbi:hypothetical protein ACMX2M_28110 [Paenibacillus polymyxa]